MQTKLSKTYTLVVDKGIEGAKEYVEQQSREP